MSNCDVDLQLNTASNLYFPGPYKMGFRLYVRTKYSELIKNNESTTGLQAFINETRDAMALSFQVREFEYAHSSSG